MDAELNQQLQWASKDTLLQLIQELAQRHPELHTEIAALLTQTGAQGEEIDEGFTEDWDFSGDEHLVLRTMNRTPLLPPDSEAYRQRVKNYAARLGNKESPGAITQDLAQLLEEAEQRAEQHDYAGALDIYAILFDERLQDYPPMLTAIFDEAIDIATPTLEVLLEDASSNAMFDSATVTLSPLLTANVRLSWLERLFALWVKRLDARTNDEDLAEIMLNVAWDEDISMLRSLAQNELQRQPRSEHSNIVDITQQYRTRTLEKFLRELPRV